VARALASEDPSTMDAAANELDRAGYHDEARLLRTEAEAIRRGAQVVPVPPPSPPPEPKKGMDTPAAHTEPANTYTPPYEPTKNYYTVSKRGESFWSIAQDFTGNGNRAPELMAVNKSKKPPPPATWIGERLELPQSWPSTKRGAPPAPLPTTFLPPSPPPLPPIPLPGVTPAALPLPAPAQGPVPEDPNRAGARALTDYLVSIGGLAGREREDRSRVSAFQAQENLNVDGKYGSGTSILILEKYGIIPVAPYYWSRTRSAEQKRIYIARVNELAAADPQRAAEYAKLIADTQRS